MASLTEDAIFEAAIQIMISTDRRITIHFAGKDVSVRFPTTRKLAEHLQIPHYYMLPCFAMMEEKALITRMERVGISTTQKGSRKLITLLAAKYRKDAERILGPMVFSELYQRIM